VRPLELALVLASCFLHAWWNLIYKRAGGSQIFIGWSKVAEGVIFLPVFVAYLITHEVALADLVPFAVIGAALTGLAYIFLGLAYAAGHMSIVYPLSRAGILIFLPLLAYLLIGQTISYTGVVAIAVVIAGSVLLQIQTGGFGELQALGRTLRHRANWLALLVALMAAGYTLWDRHSVRHLPAFLYFYSYTALIAAGYLAWLWSRRERALAELRTRMRPIVEVGVLNTAGYLLVLLALRDANPTYVIAARQLSIGMGAMLGWWLLREQTSPSKMAGVLLLIVGCVLVAVA
jgi:uncharacterized membrane protein